LGLLGRWVCSTREATHDVANNDTAPQKSVATMSAARRSADKVSIPKI